MKTISFGVWNLKSMRFRQWVAISIISFIIICSVSINANNSKIYPCSTQLTSTQPLPENVYSEIETLSGWYRYLDTPGHREAENYIFSKFESYGLNTSRMEYTVNRQDGSKRGCNVLGLLEGTTVPNKWLVVGGHYDANQYATSGAYDNAAGAGTVLELARYFTEYFDTTCGPASSILFATWDAEEGGGAGSKHFVENLPAGVDVVAYLNFDMCCLNYPIRNSIPGSTEDYFKLNLYTSPVSDFSGYSNIELNESTQENFTIFQELLMNITYQKNDYPLEWVPVMDDTAVISDHSHFIRNSIPSVWFRGMNEYPRNEGDLNERNFKHTPVDTLETMELFAGSKAELLKGINTGLTIGYQLILEVLNLTTPLLEVTLEPEESVDEEKMKEVCFSWWVIALVMVVVVFLAIYYFIPRLKKKRIS